MRYDKRRQLFQKTPVGVGERRGPVRIDIDLRHHLVSLENRDHDLAAHVDAAGQIVVLGGDIVHQKGVAAFRRTELERIEDDTKAYLKGLGRGLLG